MSTEQVSSTSNPENPTALTPSVGHPSEQLEVQEARTGEDTVDWPSGPKLWLNLTSILICAFLRGLDLTIVAITVPSLTNQFKTVSDIGWYNAAYMMTSSATVFFFGKVYTLFDVKRMFLTSIVVFWFGSVICTFAQSSMMFVIGRAIAGLGAAWQAGGVLNQLNAMFPLRKRPTWFGVMAFTQSVAMVAAPVVGGLLIQRFGWRACFGINIPLNAISFAFSAWSMEALSDNPNTNLPWMEKLKKLDLVSTFIFIPALTCLLMALQWGGIKFGWSDPRIIVLLVVSVVLLAIFGYLQYHFQEQATIPPRILKQRSILAGAWFLACCDGTLAVTENYLSIYFQGVRGLSPAHSGLLGVPMIVGLAAASMVAGVGTTKLGYYTPFMIATTVLSPIASGMLTTLDLDDQVGKAAGSLGMLGFALGVGMAAPIAAVSCILKPHEVSIGNAMVGFGAGMGSAMFTSAAALIFQNRLSDEVSKYAPGTNITTIEHAGLSDIRGTLGEDRLKRVLVGYDKTVTQTLYLPLALTILTIVGTSLTEWRSVKKKQS